MPVSSGSGGGLPLEPGFTVGAVWALDALPPRPLAQATVRTTDGRQVITDARGLFRLPGPPPADGVYLASAAGYVASAIAGYLDASPNLHLKPITGVFPAPSTTGVNPMRIQGRCVDDGGQALPGLILVLGLNGGNAPPPVTTDAQGQFAFDIQAPATGIENAALLAVDPNQAWLGAWSNLGFSGSDVWLDENPADAQQNALSLQATDHRLQVFVDRANVVGRPTSAIAMVAPNGATLGLFGDAQNAKVAQIPGIRWALSTEISDAQATMRSRLYRPDLKLNPDSNHTVIYDALLAVPDWAGGTDVTSGQPLRWEVVPGAAGYTLDLKALSGEPSAHWEAFTNLTSFPAKALPTPFPVGEYQAILTAWDAPDLLPRHLAQAPARALRQPRLDQGYRQASRRFKLTVP